MESDGLPSEDELWSIRNSIFEALPGAETLIKLFGRVPTFHDGEVELIHLVNAGPSHITIRIGYPNIFGPRHVFVTLKFVTLDVQLEGFSAQNVIQELWLRPAAVKLDHLVKVAQDDVEIELEPIYGIGGTLIGRGLSVSWSKDRVHKG
jgi:hypothetical protein